MTDPCNHGTSDTSLSVRSRRTGRGLVIELFHLPTRNSLSISDFYEFARTISEANTDPAIGYVIIRSAVAGSFSAGFRLNSNAAESLTDGTAADASRAAMAALTDTRVPTIAIVDGPAIGAGCEIALRCDLRVVTSNASFAIPAVKHGFPYPSDSIEVLKQQASKSAVTALLLGETIDSTNAVALGCAQQHHGSESADTVEGHLRRRFDFYSPTVTTYLMAAVNATSPATDPVLTAAERAVRDGDAFRSKLQSLRNKQ